MEFELELAGVADENVADEHAPYESAPYESAPRESARHECARHGGVACREFPERSSERSLEWGISIGALASLTLGLMTIAIWLVTISFSHTVSAQATLGDAAVTFVEPAPPESPAPAALPAPTHRVFYLCRGVRCYHWYLDCPLGDIAHRRPRLQHLVLTRAVAETRGYMPCHRCGERQAELPS